MNPVGNVQIINLSNNSKYNSRARDKVHKVKFLSKIYENKKVSQLPEEQENHIETFLK